MNKILNILNNEYDNHIMPFLWMHGEDEEVIRTYINKIYQSGIQSICIESRPHEAFLKNKWWQDLDIIIDECEKKGMTIWILDDKHFPTGYAAGEIITRHPDLQKAFLAFYQLDLVGPKKNTGTLIKWTTQRRPSFMSVGMEDSVEMTEEVKKGKILSIVAAPRLDFETIDETRLIDVTSYLKGDMLYWDIPEGHWRIFVCYETTEGGESATEGYLNPLVPESTDVLIRTVYEAHYEKYKEKFGNTIEGFFSDEPRFGNIKGPDAIIGKKDMPLPWKPDMLFDFAAFLEMSQSDLLLKLPLLQTGDSEEAHRLRYLFMDFITKLYQTNFTQRIGNWCEKHKVKYIGHVIEDNNAHARLGYGSGHFFRSMAGQDMSGIDVVLHQLLPNQNMGHFKSMTASGWDGEFFHFALAKLGSSLAYLDPKKQGRTMCEVFGAYGWAEGTKLMKWIIDHMLVRGVNYFVPHAFTMKNFPDPDCPPHFYAHGANPEFFGFGELMKYANKISHIFSEGKHCSDVAVLYHGEAEWSGSAMPIQKITKILTETQTEFNIVSADMIIDCHNFDHELMINNQLFKLLIVPYSQYLPHGLLEKLMTMANQNIPIIFINDLPLDSSERFNSQPILENLRNKAKVCPLNYLESELSKFDLDRLKTTKKQNDLRYFHYKQKEQSIFMLFNESMLTDTTFTFKTVSNKALLLLDVWTSEVKQLNKVNDYYTITLSKGESIILFEADETVDLFKSFSTSCNEKEEYILNNEKWEIAIDGKGCKEESCYPRIVENLPILGMGDELDNFSGKITYKTNINVVNPFQKASLILENANEIVTVYVNDEEALTRISYPYEFDVSAYLQKGNNSLRIEVINNLGRYMKDYLSQYVDFEALGISGEVKLTLYQ